MPSVVAVMAHPDDIEIHIAGILCLLKDRGWDIHFVTVCRGDAGSAVHSRAEISRIRYKEGKAAAELLGATYDCLEHDDLRVSYTSDLKTAIVAQLRLHRAEAVITHAVQDYMADHEMTSLLAREACFAASAPNWATPGLPGVGPIGGIPELYYADPTAQVDRDGATPPQPFIVDVSSVMDRKEAALACHASQRDWLRQQHGEDNYILSMREWARIRGRLAGLEYGEGLRPHLGHPFPHDLKLISALDPLAHQCVTR